MTTRSTDTATRRTLLVLAVVAVSALVLDQLSKYLVVSSMTEGERIPVLGEFLVLFYVRNPGAAFSFAEGATWIFSLLAAAVSITIIVLARRIRSKLWAVVFGLLLGGVLGNLTDRLFREPSFGLGHVVDFISTPWMLPAIYNVADIAIVVSMAIFILLTILGVGIDGTRAKNSDDAEVGTGNADDVTEGDDAASDRRDRNPATTSATDPSVDPQEPKA
ncbi:signal peptidase II [Labedella phragmitis]|uniref:signal peptidase II n=1 Tax=Labedella phragmitis TaxID=2498849 RepID=UPI001AA03F37|nr:signal peptidase II [Labedella phragmitis]